VAAFAATFVSALALWIGFVMTTFAMVVAYGS
jgi:hypothetical protein